MIDRQRQRDAVGRAFDDHVSKLFEVYLTNAVDVGPDEALKRFRNGFRIAITGLETIDALLAD